MIEPAVFIGTPIKFLNLCKIYPPTVQQVIDEEKFSKYAKLLTYSQDELEDDIEEQRKKQGKETDENLKIPTPLEYLLINCFYSKEFKAIASAAFEFFIHEEVNFLYDQKSIIIGKSEDILKIDTIEDLRIINEENYFEFQNKIRMVIGYDLIEKPDPNESAIVKHLHAATRRRKRAARKKAEGISLISYLASICCMGIGLTPLNIGEISYASMTILIQTYQKKEKYDIDIRSLLAGADPKKVKPKYWISENSDLIEVKV